MNSQRRAIDDGLGDAYAMARDVWLPEAIRLLGQLEITIGRRCWSQARRACISLRLGADSIGAELFADVANDVEAFVCARDGEAALRVVRIVTEQAGAIAQWLARRSRHAAERIEPIRRVTSR